MRLKPALVCPAWVAASLFTATVALAQDAYKIEPLKEAPPAALSVAVRETLNPEGFRVLGADGKPYAEIWLRKSVPAAARPAGANGAVQFPFLGEGELLGALRYPGEGHDYRDQSIAAGVYTLRYGLQPVNGDHLGVSPFRDYALLLPAAKDLSADDLRQKPLEERSAEAAGTSHPAILFLVTVPEPAPAAASLLHDEEKNTWGAVLPLKLGVPGEASPAPFGVQLIVAGAAASA